MDAWGRGRGRIFLPCFSPLPLSPKSQKDADTTSPLVCHVMEEGRGRTPWAVRGGCTMAAPPTYPLDRGSRGSSPPFVLPINTKGGSWEKRDKKRKREREKKKRQWREQKTERKKEEKGKQRNREKEERSIIGIERRESREEKEKRQKEEDFNPYILVPFPVWSLVLDFFNQVLKFPLNFNIYASKPMIWPN